MKTKLLLTSFILGGLLMIVSCNNSSKVDQKQPSVQTTKAEYTCPMHPEIVQDTPGTCSKCGMDLQKKEEGIKK